MWLTCFLPKLHLKKGDNSNSEHLIGSKPSHDQINQSEEGIPIKSMAKKQLALIFIVIGISSMEGSQTSK